MKSRGASLWERHIEHAVLIVAVLVMGWFAWSTFGTKISIQIGTRTLTADSIDDELLSAAESLEGKITDTTSPFPIDATEPEGDSFSTRLAVPISPNDRVVFPTIDMAWEVYQGQDIQSELRYYVEPSIAAPKEVRTHQWFGTILQSEIDMEEDLHSMFDRPPHDSSWIQVAAKFDVDEVVSTFGTPTEELEAIPSQWYDGGADIFDIQVERQMLGENGWLEPELVPVLPGHLTYRPDLKEESIDAMERESIIRNLRGGRQSEITNPDFYRLKGVVPTNLDTPQTWEGEGATQEDDEPKSELDLEMQRLENKIDQQRNRIAILEDRIENERGGGGSPLGGGGSGSGGSKLDRLRTLLSKANDELDELLYHQEELQDEIEAIDAETPEGDEVIMSGEVWVWGHDVTIRPGETYRYRMTIRLANPFFGHKPSLYPDQKDLAYKVTIESKTSEWSESILVQESSQWFVVGATQPGESISPDALDVGKISAEVFEFSDGSWKSSSIGIQVGQRLGLAKVGGFTSDWFVLDILEDTSGEVVLLQHIDNGEVQLIRPKIHASSTELQQLRRQVRDQTSASKETESEEEPDRPTPTPRGPRGGGGGGGGGAM